MIKHTAKDLANINKTKFEKWYEKTRKEYGKEGMKYLFADLECQRKMKGGEPKFRTFAQNLYNYIVAKEKGYICQKEIRYLNRKDVEYQVDSVAWLLHAKFRRNLIRMKDCA